MSGYTSGEQKVNPLLRKKNDSVMLKAETRMNGCKKGKSCSVTCAGPLWFSTMNLESDVEMEKLLWERFQKEAGNYVALKSKTDTMASKKEKEMYIDPAMAMMSGDIIHPAVTQEDDIQMDN